MKKSIMAVLVAAPLLLLLNGCVGLQMGGGPKVQAPTVGQQLIDLQRARSIGAISEPDYQAQKARLLQH